MKIRFLHYFALAAATIAAAGTARAHSFEFTDVLFVLKADGTYLVDVTMDVDALVLGVSPQIDSAQLKAELEAMAPGDLAAAIESAKAQLAKRIRIRFDGEKEVPNVDFPETWAPLQAAREDTEPSMLGITARLVGNVPEGTQAVTFGMSRAFGPVRLTMLDENTAGGGKYLLGPSEDSPPYQLARDSATIAEVGSSISDASGVWCRYLILGFTHILPYGLDHILFVLALFLLGTKLKPLLWQVTAFTAAHTVTLALSILGVVSLSPAIVEPLIALSIAYVAVENVFTDKLHAWRPALVFGFGLLHGLGFAGVLRELGLPTGRLVEGLLMFNVGVELGQLAVIGLAFAIVGWARNMKWYRSAVIIPASLAIGVVGLYWAVTRTVYGV